MEQWAMGLKPAVRNCKKDNKITEEEMDCIWAIISSVICLFTMAQTMWVMGKWMYASSHRIVKISCMC